MRFVYAVAFVDDSFVMVRNRLKGSWEMPGGIVEPGESDEDAVRREFSEETGMCFVPVSKMGVSDGVAFFGSAEELGDWPWPECVKDMRLSDKAELSEVPMFRIPKLAEDVSEVALFDQLPPDISYRREEYKTVLQEARSAVKRYVPLRNRT
jgi:8-oxo-dGTP pyrophosphatase MutT (NUDIX family)